LQLSGRTDGSYFLVWPIVFELVALAAVSIVPVKGAR
jgi:hypothetical protein